MTLGEVCQPYHLKTEGVEVLVVEMPDGRTLLSTLGLFEYPLPVRYESDDGPVHHRVEIYAVLAEFNQHAMQVMADVYVSVRKNPAIAVGGSGFNMIFGIYFTDTTTPHATFIQPDDFPVLGEVELLESSPTPLYMHWLRIVPISDQELAYVKAHGLHKLLAMFEEVGTNYLDLKRPSAC